MRGYTLLKNNYVNISAEPTFQLFFLTDNKSSDIEVVEMNKIDFNEVKRHLEKGESVFISHKRKKKTEQVQTSNEEMEEPWYFTHM